MLTIGNLLAGRYEILSVLGQGGMGTVYKAMDRELDRMVAIKVIRPEMASDPKVLERFKQEIVLARLISHPNVVRIYDLGSAGNLRFLSMEYVQGRELNEILAEKRLTPTESARMIRQICLGLEAAHKENVVHRDLKPQNIMVEAKGRVAIMDFGLAHSMESTGLTKAGTIMGTPDYMSPEQALGKKLTPQSDIFSLGVMFFEMLTGVVPFPSDSMVGTLVARTRDRAKSPAEVDEAVPGALSNIVFRCMALETKDRYANVSEIIAELDQYLETPGRTVAIRTSDAIPVAPAPPAKRSNLLLGVIAALLAVIVLVPAGWLIRNYGKEDTAKSPAKAVSILVCDFSNETGDGGFDGALEPTFSLAIEGASFVNAYNRATARNIAGQLQPNATKLDERMGQLVAMREGISIIILGRINRSGSGYRISIRALDALTGKEIATHAETAANRNKVLAATASLAAPVRRALGDSSFKSSEVSAAETYTAANLDAARAYSQAQDLRLTGKIDDAIQQYKEAIRLDPELGSAYYGLASTYTNLGNREESEKYYQMALARIERVTEREKHRIRGGYYLMNLNHEKAIEEFSELVKQFPADTGGLSNLAYVSYLRRDMKKAVEVAGRALEIYPKVPLYRSNYAMYLMYTSDFGGAEREAEKVIQASPTYLKAYNTLALAQLGQLQADKAIATYQKLAAINDRGASFANMGLADLALFQGRAEDARKLLEAGIASDLTAKRAATAAKKMVVLAEAFHSMGMKREAMAAADRALKETKEIMPVYTAALLFLDSGMESKARNLADDLSLKLETDPQLYSKLILGEIELKKGRAREALRIFQDAQKLTDTWLGRYSLGRAYLAAKSFPEAHSEFESCSKRRGETVEIFLDEAQTFRRYPPLIYYQAQTQEGLKSPSAAETYKRFLSLHADKATGPLVNEAQRHVAGR